MLVKTVCGNQLYQSNLSLVLNLLDNAGLAACLAACCVVALIVSSACPMEMFHLEARCSGFKPVILDISVDMAVLFAVIIAKNDQSFRIGSMLLSIASE